MGLEEFFTTEFDNNCKALSVDEAREILCKRFRDIQGKKIDDV